MNDNSLNLLTSDESDNLLEQAVQGIRAEAIPRFPDPPLVLLQTETEQPGAADASSSTSRKHLPAATWNVRNRYIALTGTAVAVFLGAFLVWPQTGKSAFARMQAALQEVRSVSYSVFDYHANGDTWETKIKIVEPGHIRSEQIKISESTVSNGVQLSDWSRNLRLHVDPKSRKATFYEVSPDEETAARRNQLIETLRNISDHATQDLGLTTFDDKPVHAFKTTLANGGREFKVFVDIETNLPIHMVYEQADTGFRETITNFEFDKTIDMDQFALEVPDGFAVEHIELMEPTVNAELLVVSPKTGIGPVPFGSDANSVVDFLGEPSQRRTYAPTSLPGSDQHGQGFEYLIYNSLGLEIGINSQHGITSIQCQSQKQSGPSVRSFTGQTAEGIHIGSTLSEVIAAYGDPELVRHGVHDYIRLGWSFSILKDKVAGIKVSEPTPDKIEIIVNEDGSYLQRLKSDTE